MQRSTAAEPAPGPQAAADPDIDAVLRDPAALWRTVQEASGEYIAVVDRAGIIRACNRVDGGVTADEVVGHRFTRFTLPESSATLDETLRRACEDGTTHALETTVRLPDGSLNFFALRIAPIRRGGRTVAALVCAENIRPLKASEQALTRERNVLRRLLDIHERERQFVSYEIHDGLSQYLAGALMHLEAAAPGLGDGRAARDFAEGMRLLQVAAEEARRLISNLRPPALDELGIVAAIESLADDARQDVPRVTFTHDLADGRLPPHLETVIFRIIQEALMNTRKHAGASGVDVSLARRGRTVTLRVSDDGAGFDPAAVPADRFGLEGIRRRCHFLDGEPRITSAPGRGTTIEATLPIPADA